MSRVRSLKSFSLVLIAFVVSACSVCVAEDSAFEELPLRKKVIDLPEIFGKKEKTPDPKFTVSFDKNDAKTGDTVTLSIKLELPEKSYTYSLNKSSAVVSSIKLETVKGFEAIGEQFEADKKPKSVNDPIYEKPLEKHFGTVTWTREFKVLESDSGYQIAGVLKAQICDDSTCTLRDFPFSMSLGDPVESKKIAEKAEKAIYFYSVVPERAFGKTKSKDPLELTFSVSPEKPKAGDIVTLSIHAKLDGKWHIFDTIQNPEMYGLPTKVTNWKVANLVAIESGITSEEEPEIKQPFPDDEPEVIQHYFHEKATWTRKFRWEPQTAEAEGFGISGVFQYQICDRSCLGLNKVEFRLGSLKPVNELLVDIDVNEVAQKTVISAPPLQKTDAEKLFDKGFVFFITSAFAFGFLAFLAPCVYPMIPITISVFLKKAEKEHHRPVYMASIYAGGIIGAFTLLGLIAAIIFKDVTVLNQLASAFAFNIIMAGVLFFFGLNFLGMFEIRIPSWLLTWSSKKESKGGIAGILFMALTFTLVSFTCTIPFIASLIVWAKSGAFLWPILGMLAFSTAFASPFFFLALFPSYVNNLPKSGGWMNNIKVTLGMVEIAAAFKFLNVADPQGIVFDYALVVSAWMVISFLAGLYLLGFYNLPHDTPSDRIGVPRFVFATLFICLGAYIGVGLFSEKEPTGIVWQGIRAFAPPTYEAIEIPVQSAVADSTSKADLGSLGPIQVHDKLPYALDIDKAIEVAKKQNKPLFIDFTGVNCVNCRRMEQTVLKRPANRQLLKNFVRVQLYVDTDKIHGVDDPKHSREIYEKNLKLQKEWLQDPALPTYVVASPDGLDIHQTLKGYQPTQGVFQNFLEKGLKTFEKKKTAMKDGKAVMR